MAGTPRDRTDGQRLQTVSADALFLMIVARPNTGWPPTQVVRDADGFVVTGPDLSEDHVRALGRRPFLLETCMRGVLAAGDIRHGSVKRVAYAAGEGSIAIQVIHGLLAADRLPPDSRPKEPIAGGAAA